MQVKSNFIVPLSDTSAGLSLIGGKGASLARMAAVGLPVPPGFHISTAAYRWFVSEHNLQGQILAVVNTVDSGQPTSLEGASHRICQLFIQCAIPACIDEEIREAYAELGGGDLPVAVRSSATAEDLPGASFAGQQETYLNIRGAEALLEAVKKCWASLWTARAIAYRIRQGIPPDSVALAVVVQKLVFADAAGVMFTANPLTGMLEEMIINASWGLGESIVSGSVTPDMITLDKATGRIIRQEIAEKQVMTVRTETGTREVPVPDSRKKIAVLTNDQITELARLGVEIEKLYGSSTTSITPMDIEWALAGGKFFTLQARPVTTLQKAQMTVTSAPDAPLKWESAYPRPLLARGSAVDLMPDIVSPLFATLGVPAVTRAFLDMYADVMGLQGEDVPIFEVINGYVFYCFVKVKKFWKYMWAHATTAGKLYTYGKVLAEKTHARCQGVVDKWRLADLAELQAIELYSGVKELFKISAQFLNVAIDRPIPQANFSEMFFNMFCNTFIKRKGDPAAVTFLVGLEDLPLRAEKSLFDLAQWVKTQPGLAEILLKTPSGELWMELRSDPVPPPIFQKFVTRFTTHLTEFGHILYDIDFMNPVPAETPIPILDTLKAYLSNQGSDPYSRQSEQERRQHQAKQSILRRVGPWRRKQFLKLLASAQECASLRENAIADIGIPYPQIRRLLQELGLRLVVGGGISHPEDIYWLEAKELVSLVGALDKKESLTSCNERIEVRKENWKRARQVTPPTVLPRNHLLARIYSPKKPEANRLIGKGTSAGVITASACVLRGPEDFRGLHPGDVIVAVTTTPAWTPLFAMASAVVTDIGGPLSHSSIVAREYGIPAVMATGAATRLIHTGQIITVDGSSGIVTLRG